MATKHACWALVLLTVLPMQAAAHERGLQRDLVVSIEHERVDVVVAFEMPANVTSERIATLLDYRELHDSTTPASILRGGVWQRLGIISFLFPRVASDLVLRTDGKLLALVLQDVRIEWRMDGRRRAIRGHAHFTATVPLARSFGVELDHQALRGPVRVVIQATEDWKLIKTSLPIRPGDPVLGPVTTPPHSVAARYERTH